MWEEATGENHFLDCSRLERQMGQRLSAVGYRVRPSNITLSGLSRKCFPGLGMNILSILGQSGHRMPPKPWCKLGLKEKGL